MFARHMILQLKPHMAKQFTTALEKDMMPILRQQKGFLEEVLLITPSEDEAIVISMWKEKADAEAYHHKMYPEVARMMSRFLEEPPALKTFNVEYATFRKLVVAAA